MIRRRLPSTLMKSSDLLFTTNQPSRAVHCSVVHLKKKSDSCGPIPVAVVLCGCGALDGSEISETISMGIHCAKLNLEPKYYAPDTDIKCLMNHLTKEPDKCGSKRNALVEAARLARSCISPLCECKSCNAQGLIIPGGFGTARTLSDFATKGAECYLLPDLERIIKEFNCDGKPIGTMCIATALAAKALKGAKVTLGKECPECDWPYAEAIEKVKQMGACIELQEVCGVTHCKQYNLFSTPAWLYAPATYADIHEAIGKMITMMKKCMQG